MVLQLPAETIIQALEYVNFQSILACGATCQRLREITTTSESLLYIVALGATGFQEVAGDQSRPLTISKRLARVREYDCIGSRGGQLVVSSYNADISARLMHGFWLTNKPNGDGSMSIYRADMGGLRCAAVSREERLLVTIPECQMCVILDYDPECGLLVVAYGTRLVRDWTCCAWDLGTDGPKLLASFPVRLPTWPGNWKTYGYTLLYQSHDPMNDVFERTTKDLRSGATRVLTYRVPDGMTFAFYAHNMVAEDMVITTSRWNTETHHERCPESADSPSAPFFEVYLFDEDRSPLIFTLPKR